MTTFFDQSVIKTRMQTLEARQNYRSSFHCAQRIFTEEGLLRFWTGTTPRLMRLVVGSPPIPLLA
jgi:solute carrier family 25 citrate transporter 1